MKTIPAEIRKLGWFGSSSYAITRPAYRMVFEKPVKKRGLRLLNFYTELFSCREDVASSVRFRISKGWKPNKVRLTLFFKAFDAADPASRKVFFRGIESQVLSAIKILNLLEKKLGWLRTKIYRLDPVTGIQHKNRYCFFYVEGSSRWAKAPALLSLYLLLLRSGDYLTQAEVKKLRTAKGALSLLSRKNGKKRIEFTCSVVLPLLENYRKIFGKRSLKSLWLKKPGHNYNEGINTLITGTTEDRSLYEDFKKYCRKTADKPT